MGFPEENGGLDRDPLYFLFRIRKCYLHVHWIASSVLIALADVTYDKHGGSMSAYMKITAKTLVIVNSDRGEHSEHWDVSSLESWVALHFHSFLF